MWWVALLLLSSVEGSTSWVGQFDAAGEPPAPWVKYNLGNKTPTIYKVAVVAGRTGLEARVNSSMSLLVRPVRVDLAETPIICWRWYVETPVQRADLTRKSGEDFAARLYIGFDMPEKVLSAMTRLKLALARTVYGKTLPDAALVYVWDNTHAVGTERKSVFTDRMQIVVSETGSSTARTWVMERADVAADFGRAFGNKPGTIRYIGLAADGDNTKSAGRAAFADIAFVRPNQSCPQSE